MDLRFTYIALVFCFTFPIGAFAQLAHFHPQWIDFDQTWVKVKVLKEGPVRLTASQIPDLPAGVAHENLHLFWRGKEQPVSIGKFNGTTSFSGNDFIEFWANRNDGALDSTLYRNGITGLPDPQKHTAGWHSLFDDTAAYFLTWNQIPRASAFSLTASAGVFHERFNPATSFVEEIRLNFDDFHDKKNLYLKGARPAPGRGNYEPYNHYNSDYTAGEGFLRQLTRAQSYLLSTDFIDFDSQLPASWDVRIVGTVFPYDHKLRVRVNGTSKDFSFSTTSDIENENLVFNTPLSDLRTETTEISLAPVSGSELYCALAWIRCSYPRKLIYKQLSTHSVQWPGDRSSWNGVQLTVNENAPAKLLAYDLQQGFRYEITGNAGSFEWGCENGMLPEQMLLAAPDSVNRNLHSVERVHFQHFASAPEPVDMILLTHKKLKSSAEAYAQYRQNESPAPLTVRVVYLEDVFNEYGYGSIHSGAIKAFFEDLLVNSIHKPEYVFFWGQGGYSIKFGIEDTPTWGYPASDWEFVSNFNPDSPQYTPKAAIGRVNVRSNEEGLAYLNKVKQYENTPFEEWMNKAIHLGGGASESEIRSIANSLDRDADILADSKQAWDILTYLKRLKPDPDAPVLPNRDEMISSGATLIQFFGHSDPSQLDIEILTAQEYNNVGRYFFMIANGCYSGDFADSPRGRTLGENFIIADSMGAIGYLSNASIGFLGIMSDMTRRFYEMAFRDSLGMPVGKVLQRVNQQAMSNGVPVAWMRNHLREVHLQCDPALSLYRPNKPDLQFQFAECKMNPNPIQLTDSVIQFQISYKNIGLAFKDSFSLRLNHEAELASGNNGIKQEFRLPAFTKKDTLIISWIWRPELQVPGLHRFTFQLDNKESLDELDENNNVWEIEQVIPSNEPILVEPAPFEVVNSQMLNFSALLPSDNFNDSLFVWFECDTSIGFNSSFLQRSNQIKLPSGKLQWIAQLQGPDSTVYFWRIRTERMNPDNWVSASFQYIEGQKGWGQSHTEQLSSLSTLQMEWLKKQELWASDSIDYDLSVGLWPVKFNIDAGAIGTVDLSVNSDVKRNLLGYIEIDRLTGRPITKHPKWGNINFLDPAIEFDSLQTLIDNLQDGQQFMLLCPYPTLKAWPIAFFDELLPKLGLSGDSLKGFVERKEQNIGMIYFGAKNATLGSGIELFRPTRPDGNYSLDLKLTIPGTFGKASTNRIGPAKSWGKMESLVQYTNAEDTSTIRILGHSRNGQIDTLALITNREVQLLLDSVSAFQYPWLSLDWEPKDESEHTIAQLKRWHVLYEKTMELALSRLDTNGYFEIQSGSTLPFGVLAHAIAGDIPEKLALQWLLSDSNGNSVHQYTNEVLKLKDTASYFFELPVGLKPAAYRLTATLNPGTSIPETYRFNNSLSFDVQIFVVPDTTIPRLEVWLDDRRAKNDVNTSRNPAFRIEMTDDALDMPLQDSMLCSVYFTPYHTDSRSEHRKTAQSYSGQFEFEASDALLPNNRCVWYFNPTEVDTGLHELYIEAFDQEGKALQVPHYRLLVRVLKNESSSNSWSLVPNPARGQLFLYVPANNTAHPENSIIELWNMQGERLLQLSTGSIINFNTEKGAAINIPLLPSQGNGIPAGVYVWRIVDTEGENLKVTQSEWNRLIWLGE